MAALLDATATLPGAPPASAQTFTNQTVRLVMRLSLGGDTLRVKVSNLFGKAPVTFSGVHVARTASTTAIDPASDHAVTFSGQSSVTLAAGAELYSDPVALAVPAMANISVSLYFAGATVMPTFNPVPMQTGFVGAGNQLSDTSITGTADPFTPYIALAAVETSSTLPTNVVVAFGDSTTLGYASTPDAQRRYPDLLDARLKAAGLSRTGVVNAGISGNRWIFDYAGPNGASRFDRDVLNVAGVTHTIIQLGINDIGFSVDQAPTQEVSAQQIINAIDTAVGKAKARGLRVLLGTLMPFKGAAAYFSVGGEAKRQAVNAWIRGNTTVDGVVDFDQAMRSAADAATLNPAYDSGDHLHPNDAGYAAMAAAVDLTKLQ
jgi:lysophospholipase L1-like esterase